MAQSDHTQLLDKILNSNQKLREFHSDWNKLLESDDEEEVESSLADDFSSTLRCSDYSESDLMDAVVIGTLECSSRQPGEILDDSATSPNESAFDQEDELGQPDSGLDLCSSSSHSDEVPLIPMLPVQESTTNLLPLPTESLTENSAVFYYSNREQTNQSDTTEESAVTSNKRNYDDFKTPTKAVSKTKANDDDLFRKPFGSPRLSRSSSRTSMRSTSTNAEPPLKRHSSAPLRSPKEFEMDQQVIQRRQKQIDYGKNTIGYQTYVHRVPKHQRDRENPVTPDKFIKFSRRSWDQQVKIWRKKIHEYDPTEVIHYQSTKEERQALNHIREVKKHLNFDQLSSVANNNSTSNLKNVESANVEVPFDEIDVSDILDVQDFSL